MENLRELYKLYTGVLPIDISEIPRSVSTRKYYRIKGSNQSLIGTFSPDVRETNAFVTFSRIFKHSGIHVPEVYMVSDDQLYYLQEDLGNVCLYDILAKDRSTGNEEADDIWHYYMQAIDELIKVQLLGDKKFDFSICVPRPKFDSQSVLWDLYHFKYYFLKPSGLPFDEQSLEVAFHHLAKLISSIDTKGFMFRDFQSRNIMIKDGKSYLIDFQGGREGPLHYDLASLIFESKAGLNEKDRTILIEYYINSLSRSINIDKERFMKEFYLVALIRVLQALGAYGLRGQIEKNAVFLQSIPTGLQNLQHILQHLDSTEIETYAFDLLYQLSNLQKNYRSLPESNNGLTITVYSFSYRNRIPDDMTGNGGGIVYDCRFLENPGKYESLKEYCGLDRPVQDFLDKDQTVYDFFESIKKQLESVITSYEKRGYDNLMVSFGCTGGKHRSVYMARKAALWLRQYNNLRIIEIHRELNKEF